MIKILRPLAFILCLSVLSAPLFASRKPLSAPEIIRLSSRAALGGKGALRKLVSERNRQIAQGENFNLDTLTRVISVLSPTDLSSKIQRSKLPESFPPKFQPQASIAVLVPKVESVDYFNFSEGEKRTFEGHKKSLADRDWSPVDEKMEMVTLSTRKRGRDVFEARVFCQILSASRGIVQKQSLDTWTVTPSGVWLKRQAILDDDPDRPAETLVSADAARIVRLPIRVGEVSNDFLVESASDSLQLKGIVEKFNFDRLDGLVSMDVFDRRWSLSGKTVPGINAPALSGEDRETVPAEMRGSAVVSDSSVEEAATSTETLRPSLNVSSYLLPRRELSLLYWENFVSGDKTLLSVNSETINQTAAFFLREGPEMRWFFDRVLIEENVTAPAAAFENMVSEMTWPDFCLALARGGSFETMSGFSGRSPESGRVHNLALFREIQFSSGAAASHRPQMIANLVISVDKKHLTAQDAVRWAAPALNALQAAGYEVRISFDRVLPGVQLYYFLAEENRMSSRTFSALEKMMSEENSGEGPIVILHPLSEIRYSGRDKKIRKMFHIPSSEGGWMQNPPESVQFYGKDAAWGDRGRRTEFGFTRILQERLKDEGGSAVLSTVLNSASLSLILRSGNGFLINGNYLDFEAACYISHLLNGMLRSPVTADVVVTPSRVAALAVADTDFKIKTPALESGGVWKITLFNAEGNKIKEETVPGNKSYETRLRVWELAVLLAV